MARKKNVPVNPANEPTLPVADSLPANAGGQGVAAATPYPPSFAEAQAAEAVRTSQSVPSFVEYKVGEVKWRCGRFDSLVAEIGQLTPDNVGALHEMVCRNERSWKILRRLFGIMPVLPASDYPTEEMRSWGRDELCSDMGMEKKHLQEELDGVRGLWKAANTPYRTSPVEPRTSNEIPKKPTFELDLEAEVKLLERYALPTKFPSPALRDWFVARVKDFEKLLLERTTMGLARNILMNELQIQRFDAALMDFDKFFPGGKEYQALLSQRSNLEDANRDNLEEMRKLAPWFSSVGGKHSFIGTLSDVTRAMQEYYSSGDTTLADGIYTLTEVMVECRRSVQAPEPQYRAGVAVYRNMAKAFLFDPHWQTRLPRQKDGELHSAIRSQLKKLDAAWKAAYVQEEIESCAPLPDLENEGEFDDLPVL